MEPVLQFLLGMVIRSFLENFSAIFGGEGLSSMYIVAMGHFNLENRMTCM